MHDSNKVIKRVVGAPDKLLIDWTVANVCNYNCLYCEDSAKDGSYSWPELPAVAQTLENIKNVYPDKQYVYTLLGGELTLWKQFDTFIDLLKTKTPDSVIKLLTNGRMPAAYWQKMGPLLDAIQFSYHAANTDTDKFVNSVSYCSSPNINVFVMMDPLHWDKCVDAYNKLTQCNNVRSIAPKPIDNRAVSYDSKLLDYTEEQLHWIKTTRHFNSSIQAEPIIKTEVEYTDGTISDVEPNNLIIDGQTNWKGWQCAIGLEKLCFRPEGRIKRGSACDVGEVLGNWRTGEMSITNPTWVTCPKDSCFCGNDISVGKVNNLIWKS